MGFIPCRRRLLRRISRRAIEPRGQANICVRKRRWLFYYFYPGGESGEKGTFLGHGENNLARRWRLCNSTMADWPLRRRDSPMDISANSNAIVSLTIAGAIIWMVYAFASGRRLIKPKAAVPNLHDGYAHPIKQRTEEVIRESDGSMERARQRSMARVLPFRRRL